MLCCNFAAEARAAKQQHDASPGAGFVADGGTPSPDYDLLDLTVETSQPSAGSCTVDIEMVVQAGFGPEDDASLQFGLFTAEGASGTLGLTSELVHAYRYADAAGGIHHYAASVVVEEGSNGTLYAGGEQPTGFVAEDALDWSCT